VVVPYERMEDDVQRRCGSSRRLLKDGAKPSLGSLNIPEGCAAVRVQRQIYAISSKEHTCGMPDKVTCMRVSTSTRNSWGLDPLTVQLCMIIVQDRLSDTGYLGDQRVAFSAPDNRLYVTGSKNMLCIRNHNSLVPCVSSLSFL
jgi:hypothetical protein